MSLMSDINHTTRKQWHHKEKKIMFQVQARTESGQIRQFKTVDEAFNFAAIQASKDEDLVVKISFSVPTSEQIRLIRTEHGWLLEDVFGERSADRIRF